MRYPATLITFDSLDFAPVWDLQRWLVQERAADRRPDTLILLEHKPVFTIGRSGRDVHCGGSEESLRSRGLPVFHIERGGSVTYHGPGQVVVYPILRLRSFCSGPKTYMRMLEEVVIRVLAEWGITGLRLEKLTGVWVGERESQKIAAMGVRIVDGVTMHGFALNVALDLEPFRHIQPCGIPNCQVTSMTKLLGRPVDLEKVRSRIAQTFAEVFGLRWLQQANGHHLPFMPRATQSRNPESLGVRDRSRHTLEMPTCEEPTPRTTLRGGCL